MWFCNECKSPASHRSEEEKCLLLQKEVDCLKRELSCTVKLLEGLEYTVELQKSLLKCNVGNASTSPSSLNHLQPGSSTYSEALKKPKVNNSSVLLIKANNDVSDTDVLQDITTSVNPNLNTPEQVIESIATLNKIDETSHIKYVTKLKHFESTNLLIEVSPDLRKLILNKGYLYVGWKRCEVSDHIHILRCSKCCAYGHTAKNKLAVCKSISEECVNCINFNKSGKRNVATNHASNSKECTVFKNYIETLNSRIDYGYCIEICTH
nr:unnamed protein product [Callosobruchus analis]